MGQNGGNGFNMKNDKNSDNTSGSSWMKNDGKEKESIGNIKKKGKGNGNAWAYGHNKDNKNKQGVGIVEKYKWNEENRLKQADINGKSTYFLYNAAGERTIKRGQHGETLYVDEFCQLQNRNTVTKHIFVGATRIVSKLSHYNADMSDPEYELENVYYYHPDHLGSTTFVTDPDGFEYEHLEYTPYGETWIEEVSNPNVIGYKFTSKELDEETGLYYYGARYLDLATGRWMSTDPVIEKYLPATPVNEEIRKRNGNLPGQGGVFNPVNIVEYLLIYFAFPYHHQRREY